MLGGWGRRVGRGFMITDDWGSLLRRGGRCVIMEELALCMNTGILRHEGHAVLSDRLAACIDRSLALQLLELLHMILPAHQVSEKRRQTSSGTSLNAF